MVHKKKKKCLPGHRTNFQKSVDQNQSFLFLALMSTKHKWNIFFVSETPDKSHNVSVYYQSPSNDNTRCNWYGKDGNTGPDYDCNQIGWEVVVRRWDAVLLSLCNVEVYGGK